MGNIWSQSFPPEAKFTEQNLPDQTGKVFIVTGASAGVGKELAQILYSHNAKVYVAARSEERSKTAIESIKAAFPNAQGQLVYLHLDLADLSTIKKSANDFLAKETRLDVLFNNAGVMVPPQGSKTKQGYELQLGTNNLGPFLFTKLLTPVLLRTAASKDLSPGDVRIVWVSSSAAELMAPKGGIIMENLDYRVDKRAGYKYGVSKAGNVYHATEYSKRYGSDGILSVALNPGNLKSDLGRHLSWLETLLISFLVHTPIHGAYTELFAGLSPEVTPAHNGTWIIPWGRFGKLNKDLTAGSKTRAEGGTGIAEAWWEWSEEQVKPYL